MTGASPAAPPIEMCDVAMTSLRDQSLPVAEQVNWSVHPGDYWVVAGLHGSGKSDFLLTTAGLLPPAGGRYRLFGEQMPIFDEARLATRLRLGLVFDGGQLFSHLTVAQNVALPLRYHRDLTPAEADAEVAALLRAMDLTDQAEARPSALGRSWQKRVGLARALILKPELLLIDEPLGGLDLRHTHWWLSFLDQLSRGHSPCHQPAVTLVVTTAEFRPWRGHGRQFALLQQNRLLPLGGWDQLQSSTEPQVRELLTERHLTESTE
jgi:ABC-type transporter Mla maintaining outer membrane lipid asymmetry ATPase subunit MlaF